MFFIFLIIFIISTTVNFFLMTILTFIISKTAQNTEVTDTEISFLDDPGEVHLIQMPLFTHNTNSAYSFTFVFKPFIPICLVYCLIPFLPF